MNRKKVVDDVIKIKLLIQRSGKDFTKDDIYNIYKFLELYCNKDVIADIKYDEH